MPMRGPLRRLLPMLVLIGLLAMESCKMPVAPQVRRISKLEINRKNEDRKFQFQLGIEVHNPNKYKVKLKAYDLQVYLNEKLIGEASEKRKQVMPKLSTTTLRFAILSDLRKILGGIGGLAGSLFSGKKGFDMRIKGEIRARALGFGKTIPVDFVRNIPWKELVN